MIKTAQTAVMFGSMYVLVCISIPASAISKEHVQHVSLNSPEESVDQEAIKPPLDTLWSARKTTASLLDPDWMVAGEVVPQYWPITGEPGDPPLKIVTESQLH